jgi:hypothetical protein
MANANDATEQIKLLIDFGATDNTVQQIRQDQRLDDIAEALAQQNEALRLQQANQPSASQIRQANEQALEQQQIQQLAVERVSSIYSDLGLDNNEAYLSRLSGDLGATIDFKLDEELQRLSRAGRDPDTEFERNIIRQAKQVLAAEEADFLQQNPDAQPYTSVPTDRRQDLASADTFFDGVKKAAATGLAGIPGLAGIAASAAGAEDLGQSLGGLASDIRSAAPTDIGSEAASLQASEIIRRAGLADNDPDKISLLDAARQVGSLTLTDGDFAADLLANTAGAALGGGAVTGAARAGARLAGSVAGRAGATGTGQALTNLGTRAAPTGGVIQGTAAATPAIGVGLGSGVDENLTTEQARILAGAGAISAPIAGLTGALGGQVAEQALGNLGRRAGQVLPARIQPGANPVVSSAPSIGQAAGRVGVSATGEAAQEFVEGGGEALGQFAQQNPNLSVGQVLTNQEAQRQALASGAVGAPLGAGLGGALGAGSVALDARQGASNARLADQIGAQREALSQARTQEQQQNLLQSLPGSQAGDTEEDLISRGEARLQRLAQEQNSLISEIARVRSEREQSRISRELDINNPDNPSADIAPVEPQSPDPLDFNRPLTQAEQTEQLRTRISERAFRDARRDQQLASDELTRQEQERLQQRQEQERQQELEFEQAAQSMAEAVRSGNLAQAQERQALADSIRDEIERVQQGRESAQVARQATLESREARSQQTDAELFSQMSEAVRSGNLAQAQEIEFQRQLSEQASSDLLSQVQQEADNQFSEFRPESVPLNKSIRAAFKPLLGASPAVDVAEITPAQRRRAAAASVVNSFRLDLEFDQLAAPQKKAIADYLEKATSLTQGRRTSVGSELEQMALNSGLSLEDAQSFSQQVTAQINEDMTPREFQDTVASVYNPFAEIPNASTQQEENVQEQVEEEIESEIQGEVDFDAPPLQEEETTVDNIISLEELFTPDTDSEGQFVVSDPDTVKRFRTFANTGKNKDPDATLIPRKKRTRISKLQAVTDYRKILKEKPDGPYTEKEANTIRKGVATYLKAIDNAKKLDAPEAGGNNTGNPARTRAARPVLTRSVGAQAIPDGTRTLPDADLNGLPAPQQFSTADVDQALRDFTASWPKKATDGVVIVQTTSDLPSDIRPDIPVSGFTDGNVAYLVADQIQSAFEVGNVLTEELFHRGLSRSLGGNYDLTLQRTFRTRGGVTGLLELLRENVPTNTFETRYQNLIAQAQSGDRDSQIELTDEVLAQLAQSPFIDKGIAKTLKQIVNKFKKYLKRFLPAQWFDKVSDADLMAMISEANRQGRESGALDQPVRVRAARPQPDAIVYRDGSGNTVQERIVVGSSEVVSSVNSPLEDFRDFAQRQAQAALDFSRSPNKREQFFKSKTWRAVQQAIADSKFTTQVVETLFRKRFDDNRIQAVVNEIQSNEQIPQELRDLITGHVEQLKSRFSVHSLGALYASRAEALAKNKDADMVVVGQDAQGNDMTFFEVMAELNSSVADLANALGVSIDAAKTSAGLYMTAKHAKERNETSFLLQVKLNDSALNSQRDALAENLTPQNMQDIRDIVYTHTDTQQRASWKGSGLTDAEADQVLSKFQGNDLQFYEAIAASSQKVVAASNTLRERQGAFSQSLKDRIAAYGWQNYVPLRGKGFNPDNEDEALSVFYGNDVFSSSFKAFEGRESLAQDVFGGLQQLAMGSLEQSTSGDYALALLTHMAANKASSEYRDGMADDGFGGDLFKGGIELFDTNSREFKRAMARRTKGTVIYYIPGQDQAIVGQLSTPEGADVITGVRNATADAVDRLFRETLTTSAGQGLGDFTSFIASLKTWRNPAFIPYDAIRNILTLGYNISVQEGGQGFRQYMNTFTEGGLNYGKDVSRFITLWQTNQFDRLAEVVASEGPGSTIAELNEFFKLGGPTSLVAALKDSQPNSFADLSQVNPGRGSATKRLQQLDQTFAVMNSVADTLSRFAYYKALQAQGQPKDVAAGLAKSVANFEQRGSITGPLSVFYAFARSAGVGTSALINSVLTGDYAGETLAITFGAGAGLYLMANMIAGYDEEEGIDELAKVEGKLYTTNFVMQFGDQKLQFGLGFGAPASAFSAGVQAMRYALGHQGLNNTFENMIAASEPTLNVSPFPVAGLFAADPTLALIGTALPSVTKPFYEVAVNLNGLGIPVYTDVVGAGQGDMTESFGVRYNSQQEMYDQITQHLSRNGYAEMNPDKLRHLMRSFGGSITYLVESAFENIKYATRDEDYAYNQKAGLYFARNFVASDFNQVSTDFYRHFNRMQELSQRVNALKQVGDTAGAQAIEQSDFYRQHKGSFERAQRQMVAINRRHRPQFINDNTTKAQKRNLQEVRDRERMQVYHLYLDQVRN